MIKNSTLIVFSFLIVSLFVIPYKGIAQCSNDNTFYGDLTTTYNGHVMTESCAYGGEYYTATVCANVTYVISTCSSTWDTQITLYSSTGTYLAYNDDGCAPGSTISYTPTAAGVIRIVLDEYNCTSNSSCVALSVQQIGECSTGSGCPNDNVLYNISATPTTVGVPVTISNMYAGEYLNVNVCQGASYTFASCGATYDTQLTLYSSTGTWLAHNDDGCGLQSSITWTATFTGTVRILLDQYLSSSNACASNAINTPVTITQNTACPNVCSFTSVTATDGGCFGQDNLVNFVANYTGACTIAGIWSYTTSGGWEYLAFPNPYTSGQTIPLYLGLSSTTYSYYFVLSNGVESGTYTFTTSNCQSEGCANDNVLYNVNATPATVGVPLTVNNVYAGEYLNVNVCQGASYTFATCTATYDTQLSLYSSAGSLLAFDDDGCGTYQSTITWTATYTGIVRILLDQYPCISNTTSTPVTITQNTACPATCAITSVTATNMGCQGADQLVNFVVNFTGACAVDGMWTYTSLNGWEYYDFPTNYSSGQTIGMLLTVDNTVYTYSFVLTNGVESADYTFTTTQCPAACAITSVNLQNAGCEGTSNLVYLTVNYTGTCDVYSFWTNTGAGWQEMLLPGTQLSGTPIGILLNLSNTVYQYYFQLTDGTTSSTYTYTTQNCAGPTCSNLQISYQAGECMTLQGVQYPTGTIIPTFTGACIVTGIYSSVNGGPFEFLDYTAYNSGSGTPITLFFTVTTSNYQVYYQLSNGATSPITTFDTGDCLSGETICDCAGTQLPIEALAWHGDGSLDDGTYFWGGNTNLPVDFNCVMWGFDCGDEIPAGYIAYDPYGTCSGNLPPANGCIPESCYMTSLDVLTDCYPEEVSIEVYNENQDLVAFIPEGTFTVNYQFYELQMCLPAGCYTYYIFDSASDGMSYPGCTADGQFGVYDYVNEEYYFMYNGDVYTSEFSEEFCVGPEVTCQNLQLSIQNEPCYSYQGAAVAPHISYIFSYSGACTVESIHYSLNGGAFVVLDVFDQNWSSGDEGDLYNLQLNSNYVIYYTLSDGSTSPLYGFSTGNCANEPTICDCAGTQHSVGVTAWLGDGFADNGFYQWAGQSVNFNCMTWGFDCGDIAGAPNADPYNVCSGQLPPYNGCNQPNQVLGCTDQTALNYNPAATINDGSCIYNAQIGCTNDEACNYNPTATIDNGSCEFTSCAGCTDPDANNYDPTATINDGSCDYTVISGCTNPDALNYNPLATVNDGSCIFTCLWPTVVYESYCMQNDMNNFYIDIDLNALGNGAPYTITNSYNNQQQVMNLLGSITMGPFPIGVQVVVQVTSNTLDCTPLTSSPLTEDCSIVGVYGCTDPQAINYNPEATINDGSCEYDISVGEVETESSLVLYPNPTKYQVSILNKGKGSVFQISILDNMGKLIVSEQASIQMGGNHSMDVSSLAQGHYHVQILSEGHIEHRSLIIQK